MQSVSSYDAVSYLSKFFIQTHPEHLAVSAELFGMHPQNIQKCRVLELGCGNGSNLIAHAFSLPESEFVGVDLVANHIIEANQSAQNLELNNIKFYQIDLMEMTAEKFGKFDYIIAHGLLSWVPDFVREKVFQIYNELLSPNGVGYISYNVYPGSHLREVAQGAMRFIASKSSNPVEKVNNAVSFLKFVTNETIETDILQPVLQSGLHKIMQRPMPDILHDDLSDVNQAFYFYEVAEELAKNDLQFLAEAEVNLMSAQSFSPQARSVVESLDNIIEREQYIDFLRGRFFRKTIICHNEIALNRHPAPDILDKFLIVSSIRPVNTNPDLINWSSENFVGFDGSGFEIDHPLTKMSLFLLGQRWARAIAFTDLLETAKVTLEKQGFKTEDWKKEFNIARQVLLQIYKNTNFINLQLYQPAARIEISEKPEINRLARWQLSLGENIYTLLNQTFKASDPVLRHLLELMDGTRTKEDLLKSLKGFENLGEVKNEGELSEKLENYLLLLTRMGMFV